MTAKKTAIILGATGLIGSLLVDKLSIDPDFGQVKLLVRKPFKTEDPKVSTIMVDFNDEGQFRRAMQGGEVVFCTIGTTMKNVNGDKVVYRKIDYHIPVNAAKFCRESGCNQFAIVTSLGADSRKNNFYLRLKGEIEDALTDMDFPSLMVFRPSLLMGDRDEKRSGEGIGKIVMQGISFILPQNWRPIEAEAVARSMVAASKLPATGKRIFHNKDMIRLITG